VPWIAFLLVLAPFSVSAEVIHAKVIRVSDGDTIAVLDSQNRQYKIRLAGIDAPERKQANHETSKQDLARLTFGKTVVVDWYKKDRYGRLVGTVVIDRQDVGLVQVRAGQAWWFRQYAHEQSVVEQSQYALAESAARSNARGLWKNPQAVPPWEWRAASRPR
jgi:endonuclease YncB( thermonuclease family)